MQQCFCTLRSVQKDGCYKMRVAGSFFCERHRDNYYAPNDEPKKPEPVKTNTIYCAKSGCTRLHSTYSKYCIYHRPGSKLVDSDSSTSKSYSYSTKSSKSSSSKTSSKNLTTRTMMAMMMCMIMMTMTGTDTIVIPITLTALMMQWMNSIGNRESHHEYSNNFVWQKQPLRPRPNSQV